MVTTLIRIAVCDDEPDTRQKLISWIPTIELPENCAIAFKEYASGSELAAAYGSGARFDLIFLDMIMPGLDGMDTARSVRELDGKVLIVFLTSSPDYAVQSYRVDAFDYLLKDTDRERFEPVYRKATSLIANREERMIQIRSGTTLHSIRCGSIEFIEIYAKKLSCHIIPEETIETYKPIRELEADIEGLPQFFKIHRSIIVNLSYIAQINPKFVLTATGERLPVARGKYPELEIAFLAHTARHH